MKKKKETAKDAAKSLLKRAQENLLRREIEALGAMIHERKHGQEKKREKAKK